MAENKTKSEFGFHEEEAIVSFCLDFPEDFESSLKFMRPEMFDRHEVQYVMAHILNLREKHGAVPTRELLFDFIKRQLTTTMPYEDIIKIVTRPSNQREVPMVKTSLRDWARNKAYGQIYSPEAIVAYESHDYDHLDGILKEASQINDVSTRGFWFFDQYEELLHEQSIIRYPTGFNRLDMALNGGPSPGETCVFLAATNVGKSIWLANCAVNAVEQGYDTLHITCEMSARKTARRILGSMTNQNLSTFANHASMIRTLVNRAYTAKRAKLAIYEFNPEEISVLDISALINNLRRTRNWQPKVIVIDYLELLLSKNSYYNKEEYQRQKHVATEVCGLAKTENAVLYSATQTNRSGSGTASGDEVAELTKMAESYGKAMPPDYVVSLNQSKEEYQADPPQIRMFIAKNREGEKLVTITCNVNYATMKVRET